MIDLGDGRMMNTNGNVRIVLELKKTKTGWFVVTSPFQREGNETRFPQKNLLFLHPSLHREKMVLENESPSG